MTYGSEGILHGFNSILLQNEKGEPQPVYSVASGLDYPSVGPEHAYLRDLGRVSYVTASDDEAIDAFFILSRLEGIIPALESAHAVAYAMKLAKEMGTGSILVNWISCWKTMVTDWANNTHRPARQNNPLFASEAVHFDSLRFLFSLFSIHQSAIFF